MRKLLWLCRYNVINNDADDDDAALLFGLAKLVGIWLVFKVYLCGYCL